MTAYHEAMKVGAEALRGYKASKEAGAETHPAQQVEQKEA